MIHLDTHVALWLYAEQQHRLHPAARSALAEEDDLAISPMVIVELTVLREIGRFTDEAATVLGALTAAAGVRISSASFGAVAQEAVGLAWTRDPFDRLIVANALADGARLVTKDRLIREKAPDLALWD